MASTLRIHIVAGEGAFDKYFLLFIIFQKAAVLYPQKLISSSEQRILEGTKIV